MADKLAVEHISIHILTSSISTQQPTLRIYLRITDAIKLTETLGGIAHLKILPNTCVPEYVC